MANDDKTSVDPQDEPKAPSNHIAGCAIFVIIMLTVVFVVSMGFYTYYDYKKAIVSITEETALETQTASATSPDQAKTLEQKFSAFSALVKEKKPATLELSTEEMNLAIAHFEKLQVFRGKLYVTDLVSSDDHGNDRILTRVSFPMKPGFDETRHMNGEITFKLDIAEGSIFPIIEEAKPDTGSLIPPKMMQALSTLMFTEYRNDTSIKDVFHRINTARIINGQLVITSDPNNQTQTIINTEISQDRKTETFTLIAVLVFIFTSSVAFLIWYKKLKRKQ